MGQSVANRSTAPTHTENLQPNPVARCGARDSGQKTDGRLWCAALAQPLTVDDVPYSSPAEMDRSKFVLNGAGGHYMTVFKVYVAGLYLERNATTPKEVAVLPDAADHAARNQFTLTEQAVFTWHRKSMFSKPIPGVLHMCQIF